MFSPLLKYPLVFPILLQSLISLANADGHDPELFVAGGILEDKYNVAKYLVSIQQSKYIKKYFGYFHSCGGSIIGKKKILTAAHCLASPSGEKLPASQLVVVVGIRNRFKSTSKTSIMHPSHFITHEGFNLKKNKNTANDVGLIILKENIDFVSNMIEPIGLPSAPAAVKQRCVVAGWGRVFHKGPLPAEVSYAEVTIFSPAQCEAMNILIYSAKLICAGDPSGWRNDACQGDSGGPLICEDRVVGIVSSGYECASPYSPGMYTDVYQFLEWNENGGHRLYMNYECIILILVKIFYDLR